MRNKLIGIGIVVLFVLAVGAKLGATVSELAGSLDRTQVTQIADDN